MEYGGLSEGFRRIIVGFDSTARQGTRWGDMGDPMSHRASEFRTSWVVGIIKRYNHGIPLVFLWYFGTSISWDTAPMYLKNPDLDSQQTVYVDNNTVH